MRRALLLLALASAGCTRPNDADSYFPLQPGHAWRYTVRTDWEGGSSERDTLSMRTLPPDDQLGAVSLRRRSASGVDYWLRADATGIYRVASKTDLDAAPLPDPAPRYVLRQPFVVGTSWQSTTPAYLLKRRQEFPPELRHSHAPVLMTYRIASVDDRVDVPAGRFDACIRVEGQAVLRLFADPASGWRDMPLTTTEWYCKGPGLVRLERREPASSSFLQGGVLRMDLIDWH